VVETGSIVSFFVPESCPISAVLFSSLVLVGAIGTGITAISLQQAKWTPSK